MKYIYILALVGCLTGCDQPRADTPLQPSKDISRFSIERAGVFPDTLAYGNERGIYIIHDTQTGTDYVGVSGVGISELGSHRSGKTTTTDER